MKRQVRQRTSKKHVRSSQHLVLALGLIAFSAFSGEPERPTSPTKNAGALVSGNVALSSASTITPTAENIVVLVGSSYPVLGLPVETQSPRAMTDGVVQKSNPSPKELNWDSAQNPSRDIPPNIAQETDKLATPKVNSRVATPIEVMAHYVRLTLQRSPHVFQFEAESRAAEYRVAESKEGFKPRVTLSSNLALEKQSIDATSSNKRFNQYLGQARITLPVYDQTLKAQLNQRLSSTVGADWKLTDVREQLMLKTIETYIELARNTNLVRLAQENLKKHRQYVLLMKDISRSDLGRSSDLPTVVARVALAESVLTSRLGKLEATRASWRQLTGLVADQEFSNLPSVKLPETVDALVESAFEFNPIIQSAQSDLITAQRGIDVAKAPYAPRVNAEISSKSGADWGGVIGKQTNNFAGISVEWTVWAGNGLHYASKTALEGAASAQASLDRVRDELRARVEQTWFEMQTSHASLRSFVDYSYNAQLMVNASRDQFKIGRRSLIEVLNAESELFTALSNIESTQQDLRISSWRLHSMQGRIQAELGL